MTLRTELFLVAIEAECPLLEAGSVRFVSHHPIGCVRHGGLMAVHAAILAVAKPTEGLLLFTHIGMLLVPVRRVVERRPPGPVAVRAIILLAGRMAARAQPRVGDCILAVLRYPTRRVRHCDAVAVRAELVRVTIRARLL